MKQWQETAQVLRRLDGLAAAGRRAALATVVRIEGSSYRRPGAKLLIEESGATLGGVSGGCLEADVRETALEVIRDDAPRLRHYETGQDENTVWGLGLGCNGTVDVFVQPATCPAFLAVASRVGRLLDGQAPFAATTIVGGAADVGTVTAAERTDAVTAFDGRSFTEAYVPPARLVVVGAGDDAMPLVQLATTVGFRVVVVDHRPAYLHANRFPGAFKLVEARPDRPTEELALASDCFGVVMTHSLEHDRAWLGRLLNSAVSYVGVLGPRTRTEAMLEDLGARSATRVYGPVGVDVGADGPEQIAVSILAEVLAVQAGRLPGHLRDRRVAIHAV